jgi:hypothetical protein
VGKDFLRKKNDRYITRRDYSFRKVIERDLFAACAPEQRAQVMGDIVGTVAANDLLWAPDLSGDGPINFCNGDVLAIQVSGSAAQQVRQIFSVGAALVAQVVQVENDYQLAVLRLGSR